MRTYRNEQEWRIDRFILLKVNFLSRDGKAETFASTDKNVSAYKCNGFFSLSQWYKVWKVLSVGSRGDIFSYDNWK